MADTTLRTALRLAFGVADFETDAGVVLSTALDNPLAEAAVMMSTDLSMEDGARIDLEYSHLDRLKPLETMLDECVDIRWRGDAPSGVGIPFGGKEAASG